LPEFETFLQKLPDGTVLDGEILCGIYKSEKIQALPFSLLQTRINRKKISAKIMRDAPVIFVAYDILEYSGEDIRQCSLNERKSILNQLIQDTDSALLISSPDIPFTEWHELTIARNQSRQNYAEGLMLKKKDSPYLSGRKKGFWWKWKTDPLSIDCVLIYAQKGHGRRSGLYTDYTFAVKYGTQLVSITKAYSGLTDKEIKEVDDYIKKNGIEKFGPVQTVKPELVFEIIFEGIAESSRHKSGIALRFPRIKRLRKDKTADEINTLDDLKQMLRQYNEHHVKNV
jgi:DNA ligase-1